MKKYKVDIIEDSEIVAHLIKYELEKQKRFEVELFSSGEAYLNNDPQSDILIIDFHLDQYSRLSLNGMQILKRIKAIKLNLPVIFFSGQGKLNVCVSALKNGAIDYVSKNSETYLDDLLTSVNNVANYQEGGQIMVLWRKAFHKSLFSLFIISLAIAGIMFVLTY